MAQRINALPFTAIPFGSFGGAYVQVNQAATAPFEVLILANSLNQDVLISFDGVNDHIYLVAGQSQTIASGQLIGTFDVAFANGTDIWIKNAGVAPTAGKLFLERFYY